MRDLGADKVLEEAKATAPYPNPFLSSLFFLIQPRWEEAGLRLALV